MKNFIQFFAASILALLFISTNLFSANEQFRSIATGNWNSNSTWEMSTNGGGTWFAATSTPNDTSGAIRIRNPHTVTVTVSVSANQLLIDSAGVLSINTGINFTIVPGSGDDLFMSKSGVVNGTGTVKTQGSINFNLTNGSLFNATLNVNTGTATVNDDSSPYEGKLFGNVTIDTGATLTPGASNSRDLLIYGNITNSGILTCGGGSTSVRIKGPSLINNGLVSSSGILYFDTTTTISGSGSFTPNTTYITGFGNVTLLNNITYSPSPSSGIAILTGGVFNPNGKIFTLNAGLLDMAAGSTVSASGTVKTQNSIAFYLNVTSAFNASLNVNTGTTVVNDNASPYQGKLYGNVTIDPGATLTPGSSSTRSLFIYGNISNSGLLTSGSSSTSVRIRGASLVNNGQVSSNGVLYFDTTTSISGNGSFTPAYTVISGSGNVTLLNDITYSPSVSIGILTGGIFNPNGKIFTMTSGLLDMAAGSTVSAPGTVKTQNSIVFYLTATSAFNAALNVNSGTTVVNDNASPYQGKLFGDVTIDASATLTPGSSSSRNLFIYGSVTNNGLLTSGTGSTSVRIKGPSLVNNGQVASVGTLYFDTTTTISGNGSFIPNTTYITGFGNVTLLNDITFSPSGGIGILSGGVLNPNGKIFTMTSGLLDMAAGSTVSAPGTVKTQNSIVFYLTATSAFNAALNVNTGTTVVNDNSSPYEGKLYGNVTVDASATLTPGPSSSRDLFMYGTVTNNGTISASTGSTSIRIKGSSLVNNGLINTVGSFFMDAVTTLSGTGSFTSHVTLADIANVTLTSLHQMHTLTVSPGTTLNISNQWLKLTGSNPLAVSGTFIGTGSAVEYNGESAQTVSTTGITYSRLRINNASGTSLANNVTVTDSLIVQLGILDIGTRILTVSSNGYVLESPGNLVKGTTGYLTTTRTVNAPSSLNVGGLGAVLTTASNLGNTEIKRGFAVQTGGSIKRYFDITPANNAGLNATLVFKFDESELNLRPEASLKLFKSTNAGVNWTNMGGIVNTSLNQITISGLSSFSRWTADSSGVSAVINFAIEGYYNNSTNRLKKEDTVRIYLRQISSPYTVVDSSKTMLDSVLLRAACIFPNAVTGTYYIQIRHRNALETWSKSGGESYTAGFTLNYDFLTTSASAFGGNQKQVDASPVRFAIYSGDVTQTGEVDITDLSLIDNDVDDFVSGYVSTDLDGNNFVDLDDLAIADNNAYNYVSVLKP